MLNYYILFLKRLISTLILFDQLNYCHIFIEEKNASKSKLKKKPTKTQEAKKILKKKFKVNTKIVFTEDGELVQQWPPVQKSSLAKADEEDDASGINLDKAKEILREEDKFDKEEYRKKIKEKHRVTDKCENLDYVLLKACFMCKASHFQRIKK
ncbi:hypothetical protein llap_6317 [Limosa lapponica baueri]|uniref:DDX10 n=1 Tax=Limosa lapponica baueri TaxID=1758121 RepID=A0A2I0UBL2_LIMLA|nr:hypothetical protein llap_6317 [Limosa lapponica baueri]